MMILAGIAVVLAVCLVNHRGPRKARQADKIDLHGYKHRARCDEILPLDYLSR
jgi:hypothetical protein